MSDKADAAAARAPGRGTKAERSEATRAALVRAARTLFAARGYAGVGTTEIVRQAGVTRGALYHHFRDKEDLFRAACEEVEAELSERVAQAALGAADPVAALRIGWQAFLDECSDPEVQRLALIDAPAVLGWEGWREIGARHGLGLIEAVLKAAIEAGAIRPAPVRPLAHVLLGALDEAALLVARADDAAAARAEVGRALEQLLDGLLVDPS